MDPKQLNILQKSAELFLRFGIRSVTMDDIATELGMSKKTVYQYYPNKKALVKNVLQLHFNQEREALSTLLNDTVNAIDEMLRIFQYNRQFLKNFNPAVLYDLKKYYQGSWTIFENYKSEFVHNIILQNIRKGMDEGLYRKNLHPEVIASLYAQKLESLFEPDLFPNTEYDATEVFRQFLEYHLRGIATAEGIKYIEANQNNLI